MYREGKDGIRRDIRYTEICQDEDSETRTECGQTPTGSQVILCWNLEVPVVTDRNGWEGGKPEGWARKCQASA
jgi:hypothetical protein